MSNQNTSSTEYTQRLQHLENGLIKRLAKPINPYRWNIRRLCSGRVLDVGCGIGRNLRYLERSDSLGVDHNQTSIDVAKNLGFKAISIEELDALKETHLEAFDTVLISHVLEHMSYLDAKELVESYLPYLRVGGKVIAICPQKKGYKSDSTHVSYFSLQDLSSLLEESGLTKVKVFSFPFPQFAGKVYIYNENIVVFTKTK